MIFFFGFFYTDLDSNLCPYHSGEVFQDPSTEWQGSVSDGILTFECDSYESNSDAHAILWQSLGTFSFNSPNPPVSGFVDIKLHKTNGVESVATLVPGEPEEPPTDCELADVNNDGSVDGTDLSLILGFWGNNCDGCAQDINNNGDVDGSDLSFVLGFWGCVNEG